MTKIFFGLIASFLIALMLGQVENIEPSIDASLQVAVLTTDEQVTYTLNNNPHYKASKLDLKNLKKQMGDLNITMNSEIAIITEKLPNIQNTFDNHTKMKTSSDIELAALKATITTLNARQEKIEHGLKNAMAIQKKLETNEKLLPEGTPAQSVGQQATAVHHSRIAFLAQRTTGFNSKGSIIPYDKNALNLGKAFDIATGLFHVPVAGVYHFYFAALKMKREISGTSSLTVQLKKIDTETVLAESHVNSNDWQGWFPVQMQATVYLEKHSVIGVKLAEGSTYQSSDETHPLTSFGGFLVSPDN
ncbi:vertebrate gliacolin-like protein [Daphnia pulex]|uniref:Vertebrate gliacolin-like protein n=1 Tax=Daphnia pulex TaxID=6669 RepID=E9HT77_DAPPU|nr:vertebrate gliacolin-like protein [Daphnia pulex]|eukprot:EFX65042.1 vertebrate gliacolin-like protein [Daphnia pulex]